MSHTPQRSPIKVAASQSQEDLRSYELVNEMLPDEDDQDGGHTMAELKSLPKSEIEQIQVQTMDKYDTEDMEAEEIPSPLPAAPALLRSQRTRTPEPGQRRSQKVSSQPWPGSPGAIEPFDWEDFESRYQKALADADQKETELLVEFEQLVQYFNVWASASSSHDSDRAVKRLQTRSRYVHLSENKLRQKKEHRSSQRTRQQLFWDGGNARLPKSLQSAGRITSKPSKITEIFCPATNSKQSEIEAFHAEHFSSAAVELFASEFIQPQPPNDDHYHEEYCEEYEDQDDGLGYYPDGVERTLTDEQIAIFRHSELEALRRAEEKACAHGARKYIEVGDDVHDSNVETMGAFSLPEANTAADGEEGEEGEIESDTPKPSSTTSSKKKKKKKSKKGRHPTTSNAGGSQQGEPGWFKRAVKPDLRKRTWDVVETGMDSLDYDELDGGSGRSTGQMTQRRRISYDD